MPNTTIWKYRLEGGPQQLVLPVGAKVVHIGEQDMRPMLWASVDPNEKRVEPRLFHVIGTGHTYNLDALTHLGTTQIRNSAGDEVVLHVFEGPGVPRG
ncbi:DUF7352 domain-containing protein [Labedaea rhizosphaerae]|uniref:DUF7352 domain-containing protein n=1 Tax=Labedaea rhizosphaerae TaxID=598644 RepID=A0A4R6SCM7_LABRH|nr:hypothetical protein [Labedaea rhizosphaerae]TDP97660.1 hypothetical protein EV186_103624 [Labedaea rhizosphaerae]